MKKRPNAPVKLEALPEPPPPPEPEAPKTRPNHPIADQVLGLLERGATEPFQIGREGLDKITDALAEAGKSGTLREAVETLVEVSHFLATTQRSPKLGDAVLQVAAAAIPALKDAKAPNVLDSLNNNARSFARFGGAVGPRAPLAGIQPPPGSKTVAAYAQAARRTCRA